MEIVDNLGYRLTDIERELRPEQFEEFKRWFTGQTVAIGKAGELLVYPWDYQRFLEREGRPDHPLMWD